MNENSFSLVPGRKRAIVCTPFLTLNPPTKLFWPLLGGTIFYDRGQLFLWNFLDILTKIHVQSPLAWSACAKIDLSPNAALRGHPSSRIPCGISRGPLQLYHIFSPSVHPCFPRLPRGVPRASPMTSCTQISAAESVSWELNRWHSNG